jgi:hypothetical protein
MIYNHIQWISSEIIPIYTLSINPPISHAFPNIAAARDEKVSPGGGISDPMAGGWVKQNNQCQTYLVGSFNSSEKYESQLGVLFPIYGKIKNVPNH